MFGLTLGLLHVASMVVSAWVHRAFGPSFFLLLAVELAIIGATLFVRVPSPRVTTAMLVGSFGLGALALMRLGFTVGVGCTFSLVCLASAIFHGPRGGLVAWLATLVALTVAVFGGDTLATGAEPGTIFVPLVVGIRYAMAILVLSAMSTALVLAVFRRLERTTRDLSAALTRERTARAAQAASERAAAHANQLKSTGRLAGRVAHDLSNALTPIVSHAAWLEEKTKGADPEVVASVREIVEAGRRAVKLSQELRAFSPRGTQQRTEVVVDDMLTNAVVRIRGALPSTVRVSAALGAADAKIRGDEELLRSSLAKLVANAVDAMPGGGEITIASTLVTFPETDAPPAARTLNGDYVEISLTDTGRGMDEATLERLFEPFFSTKAPEATSGFGLAAVHGTVHNHDGACAITSDVGKGTTVRLWFPLLREVPSQSSLAARAPTKRALVADDEAAVRRVIVRVLQRLGYECVEAGNGAEALAILQREHAALGCVVLDSVMPEIAGEKVLARLREKDRTLPVLMVSGHVESALADEIVRDERVVFLGKPFAPSDLEASLGRLLGESALVQRANA